MEDVAVLKYFDDKIQDPGKQVRLLPLFHSCDAIILRSILTEKKLSPTKCSVFTSEELLYLFYGRPAYKKRSPDANRLNAYLPVCFILDWEHVPKPKRIAPFDTGAFVNGMYKKYMHPTLKLEDFFIRPEPSPVVKTVDYFFGQSTSYYAGRPRKTISYDALDFEIEGYHTLITGDGSEPSDDRRGTFEIQLDSEIFLNKDNLKAVILPSAFTTSKVIEKFFKEQFEFEMLTYESYLVPSSDNYTHMLELTKNYLVKNSYFITR